MCHVYFSVYNMDMFTGHVHSVQQYGKRKGRKRNPARNGIYFSQPFSL